MKKHFPIAQYKAKYAGVILILLLIGIEIRSYLNFPDSFKLDRIYYFGICLGLILIFFSNEKIEKEEYMSIRLKAFAFAGLYSFFCIPFISSFFMFFTTKTRYIISAYEFVTLLLLLSIGIFYFLKAKLEK